MDLSRYNKPVNLSGPSNFFNNMSARATSTSQMVLQHGMGMEAAHHSNELAKDLASHQGGIASALSAQGHQQASSLSAQEHNQRLKEDGAGRRHEIKKIVLGHNNDIEKAAVEHHLSTGKLRTESSLRVREAGVAHKHATDLLSRVASAGEGGTPVSITSGKASASFTLKTPPSPATNPTPTVAPRQTKTFVGMPANRAAAAPAAPKGPQPTVTRGAGGKMVSLKNPTPTAAPAKKAPAKKAVAKGQPTVTRDPQTGRMIGIKKK
jgi:hypothetical protein